jgi:uncharacterized protein (TIGR03067 family)
MVREAFCFFSITAMLMSSMIQAEEKNGQQLQGSWKVVVAEAADKGVIVGDVLTFADDNRLNFEKVRDQVVKKDSATFSVDATKKPKAIDLHPDKKPVLGIYELNGDRLKMCFSRPGKPRPTKFDSPGVDSIFLFLELERQK